jgi:hypothetical protein
MAAGGVSTLTLIFQGYFERAEASDSKGKMTE